MYVVLSCYFLNVGLIVIIYGDFRPFGATARSPDVRSTGFTTGKRSHCVPDTSPTECRGISNVLANDIPATMAFYQTRSPPEKRPHYIDPTQSGPCNNLTVYCLMPP